MDALCTLDRSFVGRSHLTGTVVEILIRQTQYHLSDFSHHILDINSFTGMTLVWIYASTSTYPAPSITVRPHLQSELAPPPPIQIELTADQTPVALPLSQPPCRLVEMNYWIHCRLPESRDARKEKKLAVLSPIPSLLPHCSKHAFHFATSTSLYSIYVTYSGVLGQ